MQLLDARLQDLDAAVDVIKAGVERARRDAHHVGLSPVGFEVNEGGWGGIQAKMLGYHQWDSNPLGNGHTEVSRKRARLKLRRLGPHAARVPTVGVCEMA